VPGNERCDEIATVYATGETPNLFEGTLSEYKIPILNLNANQTLVDDKKSKSKNYYIDPVETIRQPSSLERER
jgi:hypothetical protein